MWQTTGCQLHTIEINHEDAALVPFTFSCFPKDTAPFTDMFCWRAASWVCPLASPEAFPLPCPVLPEALAAFFGFFCTVL